MRLFDELESQINIVPVFVSVDPKRDSLKVIQEYIKGNHES